MIHPIKSFAGIEGGNIDITRSFVKVLNDSSKKEDRIRTSSGRFIGKLQVIGGQVGRKPIEEKIFKDF